MDLGALFLCLGAAVATTRAPLSARGARSGRVGSVRGQRRAWLHICGRACVDVDADWCTGCASRCNNGLVTWRRIGALLACVLAASAAGYGVSASAARTSPTAVLRLTTSERYDAIAVVNRRIIVYTSPSTSSTCSSAVVNPSTLSLSNLRSGSCADPAIFGRSVIPAIAIDKDLPAPGGG